MSRCLGRLAALATAALVASGPTGAYAQQVETGCGDLVKRHDEAVGTTDGLVSQAVEQALKTTDPSGALKQLGLDGQDLSPEQAVRRGALAALAPTTQAAIAIYLLRAGNALQLLAWKGCPPPGQSR